jgi:hypothetical protein
MNSLQYFKLTSFPFIFRFSPSTIFKLLHFYFFTMIFNSYMIDKNFWTSRQVSGRAKFYIIQHGRLLLKNISVNIFSSGVNFVLLSTYMLSTYWLLCCQRIVHVVNVLIFRRTCFKRRVSNVPNALKTIDNQLKCLLIYIIVSIMSSAHEKRDVWNRLKNQYLDTYQN